ncbi:hypothetical protein GO986_00045 [Deinococcus sp. HMF7620]|uniref:Uncharacterized protein n=1 Tax=Deinococcus arboris TaxID=2682977 RepID=A0A7C9LZC3_9DEIO|nr:hypothetical protein [Deinococcus arboris]MVN85162.1 hypothetical protein [Deinococcus arboris]
MPHPVTIEGPRPIPTPWGPCEDCGGAHGLPLALPDGGRDMTLCPACYTWRAQAQAAEAHLTALAAPIVGAWAAYWTTAGVPLEDLAAIVNSLSGADLADEYGDAYRTRTLRALRWAHRAPAEVAPPMPALRTEVTSEDLPTLAEWRPAHPEGGIPRPFFISRDGRARTLYPTADTMTVLHADGSRTLLLTGYRGHTTGALGGPAGYQVPAELWPQVQAALNSEGEGGMG